MPSIDPTAFVATGAVIVGDVTLQACASVWFACVLRGDSAPIDIGCDTNLQDGTIVHVDEDAPCIVGDRVGVGHRALLHGCIVEPESLIGMGAIVLSHARIGTGAVIGAGALVPEGMEIPPGALAVGVPARVVREVDDQLRRRISHTVEHYLALARQYRDQAR